MRLGILTSGGDAPGMNACVRAFVRYALSMGIDVVGFNKGYYGVIHNNYTFLDHNSVSDIIQRGGTFLKTFRSDEFLQKEYRLTAAKNLKSLSVDAMVVIGGDGSFRGAVDLMNDTGYNVIGIPGTIDNDMAYTDFTIGFDTAVNNVINAVECIKDTMRSHDKPSFVEVMGRHCGDIALHAGVCCGAEYILVPEVAFDLKAIAEDYKKQVASGRTGGLIVMAEGVGKMEVVAAEFEALTGVKVRQNRLGFIQRGGSPTYRDRLLATRMGIAAVDCIVSGKHNRLIGINNDVITDIDVNDALKAQKHFDTELYKKGSALL